MAAEARSYPLPLSPLAPAISGDVAEVDLCKNLAVAQRALDLYYTQIEENPTSIRSLHQTGIYNQIKANKL